MKQERQFRLFSIAVLALAALACMKEGDGRETQVSRSQPQEIAPAQLEVDAVKEVDAMNASGSDQQDNAKATRFAYGKSGFAD